MKNILSTLILMSLSLGLFAQTDVRNTTPKDPKAKAILDKLTKKTKGYSTISADFEYNLKNEAAGIDETQKGKIVTKGEKYKLELAGQQVISDGETVWTYIADVEEVQLTSADEDIEEGGLSPTKIFTLYEEGFKYVYDKLETREGRNVHSIFLYPMKPGDKPFHTVILYVDKEKVQVHSMIVKGKDGNVYTYKLSNFTPNKSIPDAAFKFETPEGVEEVDLR